MSLGSLPPQNESSKPHLPENQGVKGHGDLWTWCVIDAKTKLVPSWYSGHRDTDHAIDFMSDLASRISGRCQLTTDGVNAYRVAVGLAWNGKIDFAQLVKTYAPVPGGAGRHSPSE